MIKYVTLALLLGTSSIALANNSVPDTRHIAVVGRAQLEAKPDIAVVYLQVESTKSSSAEAKTDVDNRVNQLLAGLGPFNVQSNNVSASNISTEPNYTYTVNDKRELDGYTARREIKVTLNDLQRLNAFMDFALSVQINQINNIELKSSQEEALKNEVNALAVQNAKQTGSSLAKAFDAKLGKIYSINSTSNDSRYRYGANQDVEHMIVTGNRLAKPHSPGQYLQENIVFSAAISVVFDLDVD